jgi:hypothetical protein
LNVWTLRRSGLAATAIALAMLLAIGVASSHAAVEVQPSLPDGVTLGPDEAGATVVLVPAAGQTVSARVRPAGCDSANCEEVVRAASPQPGQIGAGRRSPAASTASIVVPAKGATVVSASDASTSASTARRSTPKARAAIGIADWGTRTDQACSTLGCTVWKYTLTSHAYCDQDGWCWGTRSRYGYVGDIGCGGSGNGYSLSRDDCSFHVDPSKTDLYAASQYNVTAVVSGFPAERTHYLHRHYTLSNTWLVAN